MAKSAKLAASVVLLSLSLHVLGSHVIGYLYPAVSIALIIGVIGILLVLVATDLRSSKAVYLLAGLSAFHRVWLYTFPASMMRFDPDAYAVRSQVIINTSSIDTVVGDFYHIAAAFPITGAVTSLITNLNIDAAYAIFPLILGFVLPLFAAILACHVVPSKASAPVAAAIVTVGAPSTTFSIAPIPITLASIFLTGAVAVAVLAPTRLRLRWIILIMVFGVGATFTHKLPLLILAGISGLFVVYTKGLRVVNSEVRDSYGNMLTGLAGSLLIVQWAYATNYLQDGVFHIFELVGVSVANGNVTAPLAAERLSQPMLVSLMNNIFYPLLLEVGGVAGLLFIREYRRRNVRMLQAAAGVAVLLTVPSVVTGLGPGFQRVYIYGSAFVAALIAAGLTKVEWTDSRWRQVFAATAVVAIIISNPLSVAATPDYPGTPRQYLTAAEVEGKQFTDDHTEGVVYRDLVYGDEVVDFEAASRGDDWHQRQVPNPWDPGLLSSELYNGTLLTKGYERVSLRTNVDVWRLRGGWYRLDWNPEQSLNKVYNRVYSNGGVVTYDKPSAVV
ncbi:hypothetical protein ACFQJC_03925 [Haloferax namakaokahaiae]|uniref:Glycosyltransferase RgtA/B/C/D-like domain-containing protein n=1 Tax=Haloferax namakaokahaiae TaxID=1748331 RepID=A0ABD5ZBV2_9EURY